MVEMLRMRSGASFDLAYVDGQIKMHTRVLETLNVLLPAVQKDALRADLSTMRNDVSMHQQAAKSLRTILGGQPADGGTEDGGVGDGGPQDGGPQDGGPRDGGPRDGASDGGPDGGRADGGMLRFAKSAQ